MDIYREKRLFHVTSNVYHNYALKHLSFQSLQEKGASIKNMGFNKKGKTLSLGIFIRKGLVMSLECASEEDFSKRFREFCLDEVTILSCRLDFDFVVAYAREDNYYFLGCINNGRTFRTPTSVADILEQENNPSGLNRWSGYDYLRCKYSGKTLRRLFNEYSTERTVASLLLLLRGQDELNDNTSIFCS